jgi:hypothetical protein
VAAPAAARRSPVLTETSWSPRRELTVVEWLRQGGFLGSVARATGWWIGDWVRYGNASYGEKYEVAARVTGYDVQTLMNMAYVASRFEISRRREKLSFSHHAELAALPPDEQERWLDRAERNGLSVCGLREELRRDSPSGSSIASPVSASRSSAASTADPRREPGEAEVVCPRCGHHFPPSPSG